MIDPNIGMLPRVGVGLASGLMDAFHFGRYGVTSMIQGNDGQRQGNAVDGYDVDEGMYFDGATNYVPIPRPFNTEQLTLNASRGGWTIAILHRKGRASYSSPSWADRLIAPSEVSGFLIGYEASTSKVVLNQVGTGDILKSSWGITDTVDRHVIGVSVDARSSGGKGWMYLDGRPAASTASAQTIYGAASYNFGDLVGYSQNYMGWIYRVWVWNRILSAEEHRVLAETWRVMYRQSVGRLGVVVAGAGNPAWLSRYLDMKRAV